MRLILLSAKSGSALAAPAVMVESPCLPTCLDITPVFAVDGPVANASGLPEAHVTLADGIYLHFPAFTAYVGCFSTIESSGPAHKNAVICLTFCLGLSRNDNGAGPAVDLRKRFVRRAVI